MSNRIRQFLLLMIALSLAAAPLRATWAMPTVDSNDTVSHCEQMQKGTPPTASLDSKHMQDTKDAMDESCNGCCGKDCKNKNCNTCTPGTTAISSMITVMQALPAPTLNILFTYSNSDRTVSPPLRPPTSL